MSNQTIMRVTESRYHKGTFTVLLSCSCDWPTNKQVKVGENFSCPRCPVTVPAEPMNKITLVKAATGWQAVFSGPHAAEIVALFGTDSIPTPFTSEALPELVRREVQAKNLNVIVVLV